MPFRKVALVLMLEDLHCSDYATLNLIAWLARRGQFLLGNGIEEWPDGTAAGRYRFRHVLYQQVVYERLPVGQRPWRRNRCTPRAWWRGSGADDDRPYWLALLAEGYGQGGQVSEGLQALAEALAVAQTHGLRVWEAELYRLQGELLLQTAAPTGMLQSAVRGSSSPAQGAAETPLHQALHVACQQSAKTLELRAAMSLSRLWQRQGKNREALELLAGIYDWFTEGFDTLDLREARLLLEVD